MDIFDEKIDSGTFEVRGAKIPIELSDRILQTSTSLGLSKSDVGKQAILELLRRWNTSEASKAIAQANTLKEQDSQVFRYYVPTAIYRLAAKRQLTNTELTTAALILWLESYETLLGGLFEDRGELD